MILKEAITPYIPVTIATIDAGKMYGAPWKPTKVREVKVSNA